jgi:hypothetical protein
MIALFPDLPDSISDQTKLDCIERELGYRRRVYPRSVANGTMSQSKADREIAIMESIAADYRAKLKWEPKL